MNKRKILILLPILIIITCFNNVEAVISDPTNISGCQIWLDASDLSSITKDASDYVSQWSDKTSNAYQSNQITASKKPMYVENVLNSKGALYFDGDDSLVVSDFQLGSNMTIFAVIQHSVLGIIIEHSIDSNDYNGFYFHGPGGRPYKIRNSDVPILPPGNTDWQGTSSVLVGLWYDGSSGKYYKNGSCLNVTSTALSNNLVTQGLFIGSRNQSTYFVTGYYMEIIIYNRALSDAELKEVNFYLAEKWGLLESVDSDADGTIDSEDYAPTDNTKKLLSDIEFQDIWSPEQLDQAECVLWLDADDENYIELSGNEVTTWTSKVGSTVLTNYATNDREPILVPNAQKNRSVVSMRGDDSNHSYLIQEDYNFPATNNSTLILVYNTSDSDEGIFSYASSSDDNAYLIFDSSNLNPHIDNNAFYSGKNAHGSYKNIMFTRQSYTGNHSLYMNGDMPYTNQNIKAGFAINNVGCLVLGGDQDSVGGDFDKSQALDGDIAEIIMFNKALNMHPLDRILLERYLVAKWGYEHNNPAFVDADEDGIMDDKDADIVNEYNGFSNLTSSTIASKLVCWYDGNDPFGSGDLVVDSNKTVQTWFDKSGNANHAIGYDNKTVEAVIFPGSSNKYALDFDNDAANTQKKRFVAPNVIDASLTACTVYAVFRPDTYNEIAGVNSWSGILTMINTTTRKGLNIQFGKTNGVGSYMGNGTVSGYINDLSENEYTKNYLYGVMCNDETSTASIRINGVFRQETTMALAFDSSAKDLQIGLFYQNGGSLYFDGKIAEILIFNDDLSFAEQKEVETYLGTKWGIDVTDTDNDGILDSAEPTSTENDPQNGATAIGLPTTDLVLWLDGKDPLGTGTSPDNSEVISTWVDKSGNSNHARQGVNTDELSLDGLVTNADRYRPTYLNTDGLQSVKFEGGSGDNEHWLRTYLTTPQNATYFMVAEYNGSDPNTESYSPIIGGTSSFFIGKNINSSDVRIKAGLEGIDSTITFKPFDKITYLWTIKKNGTDITFYLNGTQEYYADFFTENISEFINICRGESTSYLGRYNISEIIAYDSVLSDGDRTTVEKYLANKWSEIKYSDTLEFSNTDESISYTKKNISFNIDSDISISGSYISAAAVFIKAGYKEGSDILEWDTTLASEYGITASFDTANGALTFSGWNMNSRYQELLRTVTYKNTSNDTAEANREIVIQLGSARLNFNGHYYECIDNELDWDAAKADANTKYLLGQKGYLVNIYSDNENDISVSKARAVGHSWIGGSENPSSTDWYWQDGPETGTKFWDGDVVGGLFNNWKSGEPNSDGDTNKDAAELYANTGNDDEQLWNDLEATVTRVGYIMEYGGMTPSFNPTSVIETLPYSKTITIIYSNNGNATALGTNF